MSLHRVVLYDFKLPKENMDLLLNGPPDISLYLRFIMTKPRSSEELEEFIEKMDYAAYQFDMLEAYKKTVQYVFAHAGISPDKILHSIKETRRGLEIVVK